jgi:hypothetical protein
MCFLDHDNCHGHGHGHVPQNHNDISSLHVLILLSVLLHVVSCLAKYAYLYPFSLKITCVDATRACKLISHAFGHACETLAAMYLHREPLIAENNPPTHRMHSSAINTFA